MNFWIDFWRKPERIYWGYLKELLVKTLSSPLRLITQDFSTNFFCDFLKKFLEKNTQDLNHISLKKIGPRIGQKFFKISALNYSKNRSSFFLVPSKEGWAKKKRQFNSSLTNPVIEKFSALNSNYLVISFEEHT